MRIAIMNSHKTSGTLFVGTSMAQPNGSLLSLFSWDLPAQCQLAQNLPGQRGPQGAVQYEALGTAEGIPRCQAARKFKRPSDPHLGAIRGIGRQEE